MKLTIVMWGKYPDEWEVVAAFTDPEAAGAYRLAERERYPSAFIWIWPETVPLDPPSVPESVPTAPDDAAEGQASDPGPDPE